MASFFIEKNMVYLSTSYSRILKRFRDIRMSTHLHTRARKVIKGDSLRGMPGTNKFSIQ